VRGKGPLRRLLAGLLGLGLGACATAPPPAPAPAAAPPPVVAAPAPPPPAGLPPSALDTLVAGHRDHAAAAEQAGRFRQALDEWKIALTLAPQDGTALEGRRRVEARIEQGVGEQIRLGRAALQKGDQLEARRRFLAALALDPANTAAFQALQSEVKEVRFVIYTVKQGDSLGSIAERYYGDRSRSEVIWETNQLPPNPRLVAGVVLKIPEIPGVPFVNPENRPHPPVEPPVRHEPSPTTPEAPAKEAPPQETTEINPLLVTAKEALDRGEFQVALVDVDKLLSGNAQNVDGVDLKKQILYGLGKSQLGRGRYDESIQTLGQLAKLAPNYQDSPTLLKRAKEQSAQAHYRQGLELYQKEKLEEAIAQWRTVLELDPQHANAKRNLERAEAQLRLLQQRQQPKKQ
jgi:tetratricopeptide (TPR) repeat protein